MLCGVVYCIGHKTGGELIVITNTKDTNVMEVYCGNQFAIYSDKDKINVSVEGNNEDGECGIGSVNRIKHLRAMKWFKNRNICIKKICTNISRNTVFWIARNYRVYGNGRNHAGQLGINDCNTKYLPVSIPFLCNKYITDIQMVGEYTLALHDRYHEATLIMENWSKQELPKDIIGLICIFTPIVNKVYSTQYRHSLRSSSSNKWSEIDNFRDDNIIKMRSGRFHTIYLQSNGMLWGNGGNQYGQLTESAKKYVEDPVAIPMFMNNQIIIKEIKCGAFHNLLLDYDGNVYSFGKNDDGQCGETVNEEKHVWKPQIIKAFKKYNIKNIDCGTYHSYCCTDNDEHFLFGCNDYNECLTFDNQKIIRIPFCINDVINKQSNDKRIVSVALDYCNTRIVVADP